MALVTFSGTGLAAAIAVAKAGVHTLLLNRPSERATAAERKVRTTPAAQKTGESRWPCTC